jgi:hypothetical protein
METIRNSYEAKCQAPSDIDEHLPTLRELTTECESVAELGVRSITSTWAFLDGLAERGAGQLWSVDIAAVPGIEQVVRMAAQAGITMEFMRADSATVDIPSVDLLFVDTWHVYGHLKRELHHHHGRVRKYIAMHDTEVDKVLGETLRCGWDVAAQARASGYPPEEIARGLQPAIDEFLAAHADEWCLHKHYANNNGLTILRRLG